MSATVHAAAAAAVDTAIADADLQEDQPVDAGAAVVQVFLCR